jgi:hypothetical protein
VYKSLSLLILAAVAGCGGNRGGQRPEPSPLQNIPLLAAGLAGQKVAILPLTLAVPAQELAGDSILGVRVRALALADSMILDAATGRAPEVTWLGPAALRQIARRSTGLGTDPDRMGHAVLRDPTLKFVPDPLRSQIRTLTALADARFVLAPAAAVFLPDPAGVRLELHLVLVDTRTGAPAWRSIATAAAATPTEAFRSAMARIFPVQGVQ